MKCFFFAFLPSIHFPSLSSFFFTMTAEWTDWKEREIWNTHFKSKQTWNTLQEKPLGKTSSVATKVEKSEANFKARRVEEGERDLFSIDSSFLSLFFPLHPHLQPSSSTRHFLSLFLNIVFSWMKNRSFMTLSYKYLCVFFLLNHSLLFLQSLFPTRDVRCSSWICHFLFFPWLLCILSFIALLSSFQFMTWTEWKNAMRERERERKKSFRKLPESSDREMLSFPPPSFGSIAMKSGKCYPCHSVLWFSFSILRRQTWEWKNIVSLSEVQRENKQREGDFDECQWETREEEREGIFKERNRRWNRQNEMMMMHYWWSKSLMPLHFLMMKLIVQSFNPRDFFQMQWIMLR